MNPATYNPANSPANAHYNGLPSSPAQVTNPFAASPVYRSVATAVSNPALFEQAGWTAQALGYGAEKVRPNVVDGGSLPLGSALYGASTATKPFAAEFAVRGPNLVPPGFQTDAFNSVQIKTSLLQSAVETITAILKSRDVDAVFRPDEFRWQCQAYFRNQETDFHALLFAHDRNSSYLLIFHRCAGDAIHFNTLVNSITCDMARQGLCEAPARPSARVFGFQARAIPDDFQMAPSEEQDLANLVAPCFTEYVDVQREALRVLANHVADNPQACKSLLSFVDQLVKLIEPGQDSDVRRLAASTLANMSVEAAPLIVENHGLPALSETVVDESASCELRRLAARVRFFLRFPACSVALPCSCKKELTL